MEREFSGKLDHHIMLTELVGIGGGTDLILCCTFRGPGEGVAIYQELLESGPGAAGQDTLSCENLVCAWVVWLVPHTHD